MKLLQFTSLAALLVSLAHGFSIQTSSSSSAACSSLFSSSRTTPRPLRPFTTRQQQHNEQCLTQWARYMASDDAGEPQPEEASSTEAVSSVAEDSGSSEDEMKEGGMWKTVLLAGPLFLKFVVVLVIKLATDLIVFPLLGLYRLARLIKRQFLKLIGVSNEPSDDKPPNGDTTSSSTA